MIVAIESHQGAIDMQVRTIGLDIAKNVFQIHGIDAAEKVVVRKQLRRSQVLEFFKALPPCLIGMEACATAHYWARELTKPVPGPVVPARRGPTSAPDVLPTPRRSARRCGGRLRRLSTSQAGVCSRARLCAAGQVLCGAAGCGRLLHRHASAIDVGAVKAPTIRSSESWQ